MTIEDLRNYHEWVSRLKLLKKTIVTDTVIASSDDYPYTSHPVSLHGVACDKKSLDEIRLLQEKINAVDSYIDTIGDVRARSLLDLHYRKCHSWAKVACETGRSMDSNKKYLKRFFKCPHLSPFVPI